jgi:hypothetical protein
VDRPPARARFDPESLLAAIQPASFRWEDIQQLVPRGMPTDRETICHAVRERFAFLAAADLEEQTLLDDQTAHRELELFGRLREDARGRARSVTR